MVINSGEMGSIEIFWITEGKSCSVLRVVTALVIINMSNSNMA